MMRDIYSRSVTTIICLSTADKKISAAPQFGSNQPRGFGGNAGLWDPPAAKKVNAGFEWLTNQPLQGSTSLVDIFWKDCYNGGPHPETLESFVRFLQSPWWTRSWVYQEFVCSPKIHFVFEDDGDSWERISTRLTSDPGFWCDVWKNRLTGKDHQDIVRAKDEQFDQQRAQKSAEEGEGESERGTSILSFEEQVHKQVDSLIKELTAPNVENEVGDLRILLRNARNFQVSDPRDKIYAFIGLARNDYGFKPSYSPENTPAHVYSDAARWIVEIDRDLNYVLEQAFVGRRDLGFFLPTWVPD
ncbi:hypothetical protein FVEG_13265 [Fusarium verticillioides 7600]|uniref:Uncharacterized protein n=1 Tax=Gibberella moniliformis (strain M3125 / FGSC 7600) TaxID=334819 RepID=W7N6C1_GIBM7|nr:hypothetical protein FVEG_13265 [Fusarium verticillioides 7600]EWG55229.1 hypothetical protein FVEG_13265 [Fusarium verticillioides 7600]